MSLYAGIDLHSNNCTVVVQDEQDRVVGRQRLANDLGTVSAWLEPYREQLAGVVVESTYNWYWLVDGLMEQGYRVHLANTTAIEQYDGLKYRDDASDARWLAKLLRLGQLPEVQPLRDRLRSDVDQPAPFFDLEAAALDEHRLAVLQQAAGHDLALEDRTPRGPGPGQDLRLEV